MVQLVRFMNWINQFTQGVFKLFAGNVIEGFQPIDFFHFFPIWYDLWLDRFAQVIRDNKLDQKTYSELRRLLPPPSNMRAILQKLMPAYKGLTIKNLDNIKLVANFLGRMLLEACPSDPFAISKNQVNSEEELAEISSNVLFSTTTPVEARKIGQLITAAGSLVHGLYNDLVTDLGWEAFGPYNSTIDSMEYSLLIRWFPNMQPKELWPDKFLAQYKEIYIYSFYQDVDWEISFVGCHTVVKSGSPVLGMRKYAVVADGKILSLDEIDNLIDDLSHKAEVLYQEIRQLSFEELKLKVMFQECYQLKVIFDAMSFDWQPTAEMMERIKNKPLLTGILPHGVMITDINEFKEVLGINLFTREVLGEKL